MEQVVLVIHMILALAIIGLVLLQRSEGGGLGIGSSGGMGSLATARTTANVLSRSTAICAGCFFVTSLILGILSGQNSRHANILDTLDKAPLAASVPATAGTTKDNKAPIGDKPSSDTSNPAAVPDNKRAADQSSAPAPVKKHENPKPVAPISE